MRVLIFGGGGMLGHRLLSELSPRHDVKVTLRRDRIAYAHLAMFTATNSFAGIDARDQTAVEKVFIAFKPDVVVNAIGFVKQRQGAQDPIPNLEINALFPHRLAQICRTSNCRLIHVSTDCVFSGTDGSYSEEDIADAQDVYGRTKLLGEVTGPDGLTLRTSLIGLELDRKTSLVEWYLAQSGRIGGFTNAIFSGLTTAEFSRIIGMLIEQHPNLDGVYHVASKPITKFELLASLTHFLDRKDVAVEPDDSFYCDRSLRSDRFMAETGYRAPEWSEMLKELAMDIKKQ